MVNVLTKILGESNVLLDEPLKKHCTFRIGGNARFYVTPENFFDLFEVIKQLNETKTKWKIVGNGSNLLFSDDGFDGVIISTSKLNHYCNLDNGEIIVSAGVTLANLTNILAELGFSGLEFACGIPGTVGGAIFMNAGAYGKEMSNVIKSVTYFNGEKVVTSRNEDLGFSYRKSFFQENPEYVIMFCEIEINLSNREMVLSEMRRFKSERVQKQPIGPSAGSVFKSVDGIPAGKLIEDCGLKNFKVGGAVVSSRHANFIINDGTATSKDVVELIEVIKARVNESCNKALQLEIEIVK